MKNSLNITIDNNFSLDLATAGNVLIFGSAGSGKSVFLHKVIDSLNKNYADKIDLVLVDLKQTEFYNYPQSITDLEQAEIVLKSLVAKLEMPTENSKPTVLICDEAAELAMGNLTNLLTQIAQNGYKANIHLVLATQMLSRGVGVYKFKQFMQTKLCFRVALKSDSMLVLGVDGAEKLRTGEFMYCSPQTNNVQLVTR